ncbi:MAG: PAS domain S-box protein [Syntrophaceae bacterium]
MEDEKNIKKQMIEELNELRKCVAELKGFEEEIKQTRASYEKFAKGFLQDSVPIQKRAEEALWESEATSRALINAPTDSVLLLDAQGVILDVNKIAAERLGKSRDELVGNYADNYLPADIAKKRRSIISKIFETGSVVRFEDERDGVWFDTVAYPIPDKHGTINKLAIIARDITDRKRAEEMLRKSEEKYRAVLENASDAILLGNEQGNLIEANRKAEELFGYPREELLQMHYTQLHPMMELEKTIAAHNDIVTHGKGGLHKGEILRKDGTIVPVDITATAVEYDGRRVLQASFRDISEYKRTEDILEELVRERTAELSEINKQLVEEITDRKRVEKALRESEEYFKAIIQNSTDIIIIVDKKGSIHFISPSVKNILGYEQEEVIGKRGIEFIIPDDIPRAIADFVKAIQTKDVVIPNSFRIRHKDGSERILEGVGKNLINNQPVAGFIMNARDITERKQAEERLRESEERYRILIETSPDPIIMYDLSGKILTANAEAAKLYGVSNVAEFLSEVKTVFDVLTKNGKAFAVANFRRTLTEGKSQKNEYLLRLRSGATITAEINSSVIKSVSGEQFAFISIIRDITNRKQAEELYRTLADSSHAGVFIVQDGKFQFVNPHIPEYSGYSENELIGKDSLNFVHPDDHDQLRVNAIDMLKGARNNPYEYRIIDRQGKIKRLMETVRSITYGGKRAILGNTMDITKRYQMESLIRQAQKMEAIGTLAGGIAHDFNNILGAIMGYTEMSLTDPKVDNRLRRYLEQIYKAGERARDLVKQILAFSRQSDEKPRPLRVSPIIKEALKLLRASLPSTIQIHQDIQSESDVILADSTQIHQIVMNLCTNAAHAMSDRKGDLKVSLYPVEINLSDDLSIHHDLSPGMFLKLTVSDTGVGIAPEIMDRIFDPFFTTKKPGEGTGMGLSVVYGIVKSFGGTITVESEKEKGARFNVYFPLLMEEGIEREREDSSRIAGGTEHILFVDDEENLVQLGTELLTSLGYEVTGRTSSLEALELFCIKPDRFDLVITDMTMPNMTGVDLAREMILIRPDVPIILCTGFSEMISKEKATSIGIRRFIMKPLLIKSLAMTIREAIDKK